MVKKSLILTLSFLALAIFIENSFAEQVQLLKDEAVKCRLEGLAAQQRQDYDTAMALFQKAISIDPAYAIAHNDLGIIYEQKGWPERAESEYLESIKIDEAYLPAYTNLAMLYEAKGDIPKAIEYWRKRAGLGLESDAWVIKAKENLKRLNAPLKEPVVIDEEKNLAIERVLVEEAEELSKNISVQKELTAKQTQEEFQKHKSQGQTYLDEQKFELAIEEFKKSRTIDPLDKELDLLIANAEARFAESLISGYSKNGIGLFNKGDYNAALTEFRKIINVLTTILDERKKEQTAASGVQ